VTWGILTCVGATAIATAVAAPAAVAAQAPAAWPDTFTSRVEALALLQTLNADLLASRSSTATLEGWCREREHRAVLYTKDNRPFSEVREVYQRGVLAFALPAR
jgi:hypothetical protein